MDGNRRLRRQDRTRGEVAAAAILAAGIAIERARAPRGGWIAAVPIVFVNYVAFRAQLRFWQAYLDRSDAFLVSAALESVAIYLAWQAHRALVKNDAALRLRLAAYGWAAGMGVLNYSHYMRPGWRPTAAAVVFGLMSAVSPWLWSIHSRRESRDDLKDRGLIEDHGVRLGPSRWFWYPLRSAMVQRLAAWAGENRPAEAIALYEQHRARNSQESYAGEDGRDTGTTVAPAAAVKMPPPASQSREPRRVAPGRAARTAGLAAASEHEQQVILRLIASREPLPSYRKLAVSDFGGRTGSSVGYHTAQRVLARARAGMNGAGSDDGS